MKLLKVIGNGSFGVVYQAKLCETGEMVAIKKVLQVNNFRIKDIKLYWKIILTVKMKASLIQCFRL